MSQPSHSEIQTLKHTLLRRLLHKPEPYGAPLETEARAVVESYLEHGNLDRVQGAWRRCEPEFRRAFRKIVRYTPQLTGTSSIKHFRMFLEHRSKCPEFYEHLCWFVGDAVENGVHYLPTAMTLYRALWELAVVNRNLKGRTLNVNIFGHYADYWTLDNPDVNFTFRRRNRNGCRRLRNFNRNEDLDQD